MKTSPFIAVTWTDPETGCAGHLVIDKLVRGAAGGGLRMRPGCTLSEVADLAAAMSIKESIAYRPGDRYLPLGGAKGGIDFDPYDPRAREVLGRYLKAMLPLLRTYWSAGEDMGVRQDDLDEIADELGLRSTVEAALRLVHDGADAGLGRINAAFATSDRGVGLGDLVGGYGVARAVVVGLKQIGRPVEGATAVIQGFGSMGGATARYLVDAGVRVIAIADAQGLVVNHDGLPVELLLRTRDRHGKIHRSALRAEDEQLSNDRWAELSCDVLVPAAMSYVLDANTVERVDTSIVVEAANVATSADAEVQLAARGIPVIPDFIANLATNAWWWWTLFGDIDSSPESAFGRINEVMTSLVEEAFAHARANQVSLRLAGLAMAETRGR